ncbi:MAG TPA: hypothetical protein VF521_13940, partial [Pyrinomonadaceae bacterium]
PATFPGREVLRVMTFGVVLFTLLAQGTTMSFVMRRLGLVRRDEAALEQERRRARLMALNAARARLDKRYREGMISKAAWEQIERELNQEIRRAHEAQRELLRERPELHAEEVEDARREGLRAQRAQLSSLLSDGVISEAVYGEMVAEVDAALQPSPDGRGAAAEEPGVDVVGT